MSIIRATGNPNADCRIYGAANNDQVATIDVRDATTKQDLVSRKLYRKDFIFAGAYQEFQLHFKNYNSSHALEFRVYFTDKARLSFDKVTITSNATTYEGESAAISHKTGGLAESNTCWQATVQNSAGHMAYGPYENGVPVGSRTVNFRLKIDNNTADNIMLLVLMCLIPLHKSCLDPETFTERILQRQTHIKTLQLTSPLLMLLTTWNSAFIMFGIPHCP